MSALCLALLIYAAIPHFHGAGPAHGFEPAASHAAERVQVAAAAASDTSDTSDAILLADLAHDSHSSSLDLETHPCTLCRDGSARALPTPPARRLCLVDLETSPCPIAASISRPGRLLAARHAARAPPRA